MDYGPTLTWLDGDPPAWGSVIVHCHEGHIAALVHRPSFDEDPEGVSDDLGRHMAVMHPAGFTFLDQGWEPWIRMAG